jgi:AmmeMemoRadiSam system protein B/AmmeMemoRadiSam system protein A
VGVGGVTRTVFIIAVIAMTISNWSSDGASGEVREPRIAGSWYPGTEKALRKQLETFFDNAEVKPPDGKIRAVIAPHAGYVYSGQTAAYAYKPLRKGDYERVILLGVNHRLGRLRAGVITAAESWETPLGQVKVDREVCDELLKDELFDSIPARSDMEHSLEIQLPFLQERLGPFKLVPIMVGDASDEDCRRMGALLKMFIDEQTLVVASSDFTHYGPNYGYVPFRDNVEENLKKLDGGAIERIDDADFKGFRDYVRKTGATICGRNCIGILLNIVPEDMKGELVHYDTSGRMTGDFGMSVSYASIRFCGDLKLLNKSERQTLLRVARDTIETYLGSEKVIDPTEGDYELTPVLRRKLGAFVTLRKHGALRGCIGIIQERTPLYRAVVEYAIHASTQDPRFPPMTAAEVKDVEIEISVMNPTADPMSPFQKVKDVAEIVIGRDGLFLKKGMAQGILLPQVPTEQGWDRDTFLEGICRKAGLPSGAWKDPEAELYRFSAQVFGE